MRRALVIRHVAHEGPAGFAVPIAAAGYAIETIDAGTVDFAAIDLVAPDLVVAMGGPMGVYDGDRLPWLAAEIAALGARLAADRPTLGVCLGSQLIAAALGARVYAGATKEIGFAPVRLGADGRAGPLRHLDGVAVLHWHGDSFDLPAGATLLASTEAYRHQAFARGAAILALQFHAEIGADARLDQWIRADAAMLAAAGIEGPAILADQARLGARAAAAGQAMLADWLAALPA